MPRDRAEAYLEYLRRTGLPESRGTPGNRGVLILQRTEGDRTDFHFLSLWESERAIAAFAGADISRAHYYPEDRDFLLEMEPTVSHFTALVDLPGAAPEAGQ